MVDNFTLACHKALCKACPSSKAKTKYKPPSNELDNLKKHCRKDFNSTMCWQNYRAVFSTYKQAIRKAKRVKWALEASRLRKILAKTNNPNGLSLVKKRLASFSMFAFQVVLERHHQLINVLQLMTRSLKNH